MPAAAASPTPATDGTSCAGPRPLERGDPAEDTGRARRPDEGEGGADEAGLVRRRADRRPGGSCGRSPRPTTDAHPRAASATTKGERPRAARPKRREPSAAWTAVGKGLDVPERTRSSSRDSARREWDDAAEACRKTPGCIPQYRDDASYGENKPLKTDQELIEDIRKRGFSEPHPLPK